MLAAARALVLRDLRLLWRRRGDALQPALFALLVVVLFALGMGTDKAQLARAAGAVLWLAALLAGLLSLDTLFRGDAEDGSLEQWMLSPVPLAWLVLVRTAMHWATTALPLLLAAPLLGELLYLPRAQLPVLVASLALGTPLLSLLGAVVAALTVGMRRSGILLALLAMSLPLNVGGWGPREGVAAWAFGAAGIGAGRGLTVAVVYGVLSLAASLPGAVVLVARWYAATRDRRATGPGQLAEKARPVEEARPRPFDRSAAAPVVRIPAQLSEVRSEKYAPKESARLARSSLPFSAVPSEGRPMTPESV